MARTNKSKLAALAKERQAVKAAERPKTFKDVLAERIATKLFTNGFGEQGTRLVLVDERGVSVRDLGGWCFDAVVRQIRDEFEHHCVEPRPQEREP